MPKTINPAYSKDLIPIDFNLFRDMKKKLRGSIFKSRDELLSVNQTILNLFEKSILISVFQVTC
jgi:hypothetical protein